MPVSASRFALAVAVFAAAASVARSEPASVPEQTVDTLNKIWGMHPGFRANHAKGAVVEGTFTPTPEAATLSKARLFKDKSTPVTVRFSDSGGLPTIPDGAGVANPHGLAMKFHQADGSDVDVVINSLKFFPAANGQEFLELLQAIAASPPDAPKPTKLDAFMSAHPAAPKALASASTPSSLAREIYYGIDAFIFVDAQGKRQPFRFKAMPELGADHLDATAAAKQPPNFLMDEIEARVKSAPVRFDLMAQLAEPGDQTKDPTKPWPDDRKLVKMGTLTLDKPVADTLSAQKKLLFLPSSLTDGIETSDDPLVDARVQAYGVSFGRRSAAQ